jgi:hypothetical protein
LSPFALLIAFRIDLDAAPQSLICFERGARQLRGYVILVILAFHSMLAYIRFVPAAAPDFDSPHYSWRAFPIVDSHRFFAFDLFCAWQDVYLMSLIFFCPACLFGRAWSARNFRVHYDFVVWLRYAMLPFGTGGRCHGRARLRGRARHELARGGLGAAPAVRRMADRCDIACRGGLLAYWHCVSFPEHGDPIFASAAASRRTRGEA